MDDKETSQEKEAKPQPSVSPFQNPQVIAALIGGIVTIAVAVVGLVPVLLERAEPTVTPIIVTATSESVLVAQNPASNTPSPTEAPSTEAPRPAEPTRTETPAPPSPTSTPTVTPASETPLPSATDAPPGNVQLLFDDVSFTVLNQDTRTVSLEGVVFRSASGEWDARMWGITLYNSLPPRNCLRLRDSAAGQRQPPAFCANLYGLQLVGTSALFWKAERFDVLRNGEVVATCEVAAASCMIYLP